MTVKTCLVIVVGRKRTEEHLQKQTIFEPWEQTNNQNYLKKEKTFLSTGITNLLQQKTDETTRGFCDIATQRRLLVTQHCVRGI